MAHQQAVYFEVFAFNPRTCEYDLWRGTATLAAATKAGLRADRTHPLYGAVAFGDADGWAFRAKI